MPDITRAVVPDFEQMVGKIRRHDSRRHHAAVSGTAFLSGGNPIGPSMLLSHVADLDMAGERTTA
jgi:hypothetical protein